MSYLEFNNSDNSQPMGKIPNLSDTPCPEVSIVMPCLNEADTLGTCIKKATKACQSHGIRFEIVVADNGSTDDSRKIAANLGAKIVNVKAKGYGNALMGGIVAARGKYVIMGDADDSYDFLEIPKFIDKLREGFSLVQGCRLPAGGGQILPGAMPLSHRWLGNPMFSYMARTWFGANVHDLYCGLRGFTKELFTRLNLKCTGMEFATEMILKASLFNETVTEVPITLHPDGRKSHGPHLKTIRDGWRTLRFFLMYSPRWLFLYPGLMLILFGIIGYSVALPGLTLFGANLDAHTLLFASLAILCGYQSILFSILSKRFAVTEGLMPDKGAVAHFLSDIHLEKGILFSLGMLFSGILLLFVAINEWRLTGFGDLDYSKTMRVVIPGATLTALGFQTLLSTFFLSILGMNRR